jgi:hypothetical protein
MIKVGNTYYWIGEYKDAGGLFLATACYSSSDLQHWTFVNKTLVQQASGDLGPNRVVERPKILYNATTHQYVETMHVDNAMYTDEGVGVATSSTVCGNYTYRGRLKLNGSTIKKWDSGSFQDTKEVVRPPTSTREIGGMQAIWALRPTSGNLLSSMEHPSLCQRFTPPGRSIRQRAR